MSTARQCILNIYGLLGLGILFSMQMVGLLSLSPLDQWVTPIGWYGYILFIDWLVYRKSRSSLLISRTKEFFVMFPWSIGLWCIFEVHNLLVKNWEYINLHPHMGIRLFGFALAFATILPAMIETHELLKAYGFFDIKISPKIFKASHLKIEILLGMICILIPVFFGNPFTGPLIWVGYFLVFPPLNYLLGFPSILKERGEGRLQSTLTLLMAGYICGVVWETLNFWAGTQWVYHVPYLEKLKFFEMPILGFLGFGPFAVAMIEMYGFGRNYLHKK